MDGIVVAFFVPAVIFMVFVAPAWIFLHYRSKGHAQGALSEAERADLAKPGHGSPNEPIGQGQPPGGQRRGPYA